MRRDEENRTDAGAIKSANPSGTRQKSDGNRLASPLGRYVLVAAVWTALMATIIGVNWKMDYHMVHELAPDEAHGAGASSTTNTLLVSTIHQHNTTISLALCGIWLIGFFAIVFDERAAHRRMAELKYSDAKLALERDQAQMYLDMAGVVLIALDRGGNIILANKKCCELLGMPEADLLGQPWFDRFVPEEIRGEMKLFFDRLMNGELDNFMEYFENTVVTASGVRRDVAWHNTVMRDAQGRIIGSFSSGEDITDKKNADRKLAAEQAEVRRLMEFQELVLTNMGSGIIVTDAFGELLLTNPLAEHILGIQGRDPVGMMLSELAPGLEALMDPSPDSNEITLDMPDGRRIDLGFNTSSICDEDGLRFGSVVIFKDITEFKGMQERLRQHERLATIGEFAGEIAHEIKNPLFAISAGIQVLETILQLDDDQKKNFQALYRETVRINQLVMDLLDYSAETKVQARSVDLCDLCKKLFTINRALFDSKSITFICRSPDGSYTVFLDENKITQVMMNLIHNAIDVTPVGGEIEMEAKLDLAGSLLVFRLMDRGPGFEQHDHEKIFNPLFSTKKSGHGMGLAICQKIVTAHGGTIRAEARPDGGTTMIVELPLMEN